METTKNEYKKEFHKTLQLRMHNFEVHWHAEREKVVKERDDLQATLLYERQLRASQGAKKLFATNFGLSFQQSFTAQ